MSTAPPSPEPRVDANAQATIDALTAELAAARQTITRLIAMVESLTHKLDILLHAKETSEGTKRAAPPPRPPGQVPAKAPKAPGRDEHGRGAPPPNLPRDEAPALKPERCDRCGHARLLAGEQLISEEYDFVRSHVRIRRTARQVCLCAHCNARVTPAQPPMPFERAACTFEMMAWLLYARCGLFLPLDRLRRDFEKQGAPLPSATLTRWWQRGADLLEPIAGAVRLELLENDHIHTDGTGLLVVFPRVKAQPVRGEARPGQAGPDGYVAPPAPLAGQVLVFCDDHHAVYHFTSDKKGHHAEDFLTTGPGLRWTGTITADAASVHDTLFANNQRIEAGCNAHALRKFRDDADKAPLLASQAMSFIGRVYDVDAEARARKLSGADLLAHRQQLSGPVMAEFRGWLELHRNDLLPRHPVRKAIQYTLNHWDALTRFLHDPKVKLDNNIAERDLRKLALLRKNALYASGEDGALRLCTLLTLINTCARIGVEPYSYLVWALGRVVPHPSNRGLTPADLTPAAYKARQQGGAE